ncbi:MAG: DUF3488 and transglutaminase-like domain-containing protein [Gammaproteobacteria bacterium]|nr:DUF3488 and transglutaminase-like domain-containing protein [Gammaproteobacteria bacterium]
MAWTLRQSLSTLAKVIHINISAWRHLPPMALPLTRFKARLRSLPPDLLWLTAGICLAVIPHIKRVPVWIPVLFFSMAVARVFLAIYVQRAQYQAVSFISLAKLLVAIVIITGILASYGTLIGRDAGVSLLILLAGMKLLETRQKRDYYITSFIGLFLILTNFFYSETLFTAIYSLLAVSIFISALIAFNDKDNFLGSGELLSASGLMLLQSLPLLIVIFLLFPRVQGPLWGMPKDTHSGLSGISDEMSPGTISQLILSDKIAFRVEFHDAMPAKSRLYWRGPVLWLTDGVKWVAGKPLPLQSPVSWSGTPVRYTVTLEPTDKRWLYGLEMPIQAPAGAFFSHDLQIKTTTPVRERRRYSLASYTNYRIDTASHTELIEALQLPYGYHNKTIALGSSWRELGLSEADIVNHALRLFNEQAFYYTLAPPLLLKDSIDEFMFETRQGFCEHYAAAFTILMRAAGIPARVVTGDQGGTINPVDGYLVVRQRDAHAWTEVWLGNRGWTRVDPTAAVAPARISDGIESALPDSIIDIPLGLYNNAAIRELWRQVSDTFTAINNYWNQWVLGYNARQQFNTLSRLGLGELDWQGMTAWLILAVTLVFLLVAFLLFTNRPKHIDAARILYDKYCARMARLGIKRYASEGPEDFAKRAIQQRSDLAAKIREITRVYVAIRYGGQAETIQHLTQQVRSFNPSK